MGLPGKGTARPFQFICRVVSNRHTLSHATLPSAMSGRPFSVRRSKTDDLLAVEEMMNMADAVQTVEARFGKQTLTELMCVASFLYPFC